MQIIVDDVYFGEMEINYVMWIMSVQVALPSRSIDSVGSDFEVISDEPFTLNLSTKLKTRMKIVFFLRKIFITPTGLT